MMNINQLASNLGAMPASPKMPVLFVGHGNPMNAITDNSYRREWQQLGQKLPLPRAVLCVSAHWLTRGTAVTMMDHPRTIHDFGGFPDELYRQQYPAPGAVAEAKSTIEKVKSVVIREDFEWGLDHGAWSVLKSMYPQADVPVYQLSIDYGKPAGYHYNLARELAFLRNRGVLIVASGNVVHNLGMVKWRGETAPYDWALEFDDLVKKSIETHNDQTLVEYHQAGRIASLAHPTNDHYLPLMYVLGVREKDEDFWFFNDSFDMGSISMRSVVFGG